MKQLEAENARLKRDHSLPQMLRLHIGPEFLGETFTAWAKANGVAIQYIQPGKPNQNAYIERFNRTFRDEVLDQHLFGRLNDVRAAAHWWMIEYNELRPHDSLGDRTPNEVRQSATRSTSELCARRGSLRPGGNCARRAGKPAKYAPETAQKMVELMPVPML